jgi:hypothetical protein
LKLLLPGIGSRLDVTRVDSVKICRAQASYHVTTVKNTARDVGIREATPCRYFRGEDNQWYRQKSPLRAREIGYRFWQIRRRGVEVQEPPTP